MWLELIAKVSRVLPAVAKTPAGVAEIVLPIATTHSVAVIPDWLRGKYVEVTPVGASVDFMCGVAATEVVYGQESSVDGTTKVITTHANSARRYVDGATRGLVVPHDLALTHFCWEGSAGSAKLYLGLSSAKVVR